jgi:hypothetical protein
MSGPETSSTPRVRRVHLRVPVALFDGRRSVPGELRNLSEGGAFVAVEPPLPLETGLSFWLPLEGHKVLVRAHVRWTRSLAGLGGEPVGCGLEFYDPDRATAIELAPLIEQAAERI